MKLAIVILHYNDSRSTEKALRCIRKLDCGESVDIIVVDNHSPDGSGEKLQTQFAEDKRIHFILENQNLGFAAGNNAGYRYAKEKLRADTILVMNSDVYIEDCDFLKKLEWAQDGLETELIAPDIVNGSGSHQNPFRYEPIAGRKLAGIYRYNCVVSILYRIPLLSHAAAWLLDRKKGTVRKKECDIRDGIVPHGSCVIFLKKWIEKEDIAFVPSTFLYMEEDILAEYCAEKGYRCKYIPCLYVYHEEDCSTDSISGKSLDKRIFISKYMRESAKVLMDMRDRRGGN